MPLMTRRAEPALSGLDTNPAAWWTDPEGERPDAAMHRLGTDTFTPMLGRHRDLDASGGVFAIGSCFARGIENALRAHVPVLSIDDAFDGLPLALPGVTGRGFMNKYTTFAIEQEVRWALDGGFPETSLVRRSDGAWEDPHANPTLLPGPYATVLERRQTLLGISRRVADASLVIITLGLVESWRDLETGTMLNMTPSREMLEAHRGRFQFELSTFQENLDALEATYACLGRHGRAEQQIVVTVSPVPLNATFTGGDVVTANTYSKSLLRTAAEEWSARHDNVHYFPSYEITLNSERPYRDGRHVRLDLVAHIMRVFRRRFLDPATGGIAQASQRGGTE